LVETEVYRIQKITFLGCFFKEEKHIFAPIFKGDVLTLINSKK